MMSDNVTELAKHRFSAHIDKVVSEAPPLTKRQIATLAALVSAGSRNGVSETRYAA